MRGNIITFVRDVPGISRYCGHAQLEYWPSLPALAHIPCMQAYSQIIRSGPGYDGIYIQRVAESPIHLIRLSNPI